ncbi:hypothetical protein, partial [Arsenicibacter rosenii]|uniref:hypothetical protein n=1 Tax=Arsenicibacter rosenii TaxID=1750698 RepID=UPI0011601339
MADQLGKEIEGLIPGTKEHTEAVRKQKEVNQQLGNTLEEQPGAWGKLANGVGTVSKAFAAFM